MAITCSRCQRQLRRHQIYTHNGRCYCEACCLAIRIQRPRKTHWQYIRSVKSDYLRKASSKKVADGTP